MNESRKGRILEGLYFLMPWVLIRRQHLTRRDVIAVKKSLCNRMGIASLFTGVLLSLFDAAMLIGLNMSAEGRYVEVYGVFSLLGLSMGLASGLTVVALQLISRLVLNEKLAYPLARIGTDLLYFAMVLEMLMMIYTDAKMGFTQNVTALSPGVIIVALLCIIQPAFWLDALILNAWSAVTLVSIAIACAQRFNMGALPYYFVIALGLPILSYLVVSVLFFAETGHYVQMKQNEMLYNSAMYDELTKCKNRTSLNRFLQGNAKRWEAHDYNLLFIMFDIDNFKEYNDQFSHPAGDICLMGVCEAIRKCFPQPDLDFFRYGGEEFLLFFEMRDPEEALLLMEQARKAVKELELPAPEGAPEKIVTISLGGTIIRTLGGFHFESALKKVDGYLYKAKGDGKDRCCLDGKTYLPK